METFLAQHGWGKVCRGRSVNLGPSQGQCSWGRCNCVRMWWKPGRPQGEKCAYPAVATAWAFTRFVQCPWLIWNCFTQEPCCMSNIGPGQKLIIQEGFWQLNLQEGYCKAVEGRLQMWENVPTSILTHFKQNFRCCIYIAPNMND